MPIAAAALGSLVPCAHGSTGCPLGVDVPALAAALRAGDAGRAYSTARATNPFASTCGHACHAPCESACNRRHFGAPVSIALLEAQAAGSAPPATAAPSGPCTSPHDARSVAGLVGLAPAAALRAPRSGRRVAVVGAGAAGLACAHDLALLGHACVVFDAAREPGGVLTRAIPAFRFPVAAARAECAAILAMGVQFHDGYPVAGAGDLRALLAGEFDAIFLAIGASDPVDALFPDQPEHERVIDAMRVLAREAVVEGRIVVAGDGDVAVDAARAIRRAALREGAPIPHVQLVLESALDDSVAPPAMIAAAIEDGVVVHAGWTPVRYLVTDRGAVSGIEVARRGERTSMVLACESIVAAGARAPGAAPFAPDVAADGRGYILTDSTTLRTTMPGVWAGGACAFGHRSIAHATADGKRAAWQIHSAFTGEPVRVAVTAAWVEVDDWDGERAERAIAARRAPEHPSLPPEDPFSPAALRAPAEVAHEAARCFDCTTLPVVDGASCTMCGKCVPACPEGAFAITGTASKELRLDQSACTRCGACVSACPEGAIAMLRAVWEARLTDAPAPTPPRHLPTVLQATPTG